MLLSAAELEVSGASIAALQQPDGLVLWTPGGHTDPWNHVEAAMALDSVGRVDEARAALEWMRRAQRPDGAWHQYYTADGVQDAKFDANTIAYVATGVWHHHLTTGDREVLTSLWPMVRNAIEWVLRLQQPTGEVLWAREPDGTPFHYALVTGSSSIHHSLGCAVAIAREIGEAPPSDWDGARARLGLALRDHQLEFFAEKDRWAMDWYYPVIGGVLRADAARDRLAARWDDFVIADAGVRCVNDHPWVTTGETAEAAIACAMAKMPDEARALLEQSRALRHDDGSYWTGLHLPSGTWFPEGERTTYSAAAVVLAHAVLRGDSPSARVFAGL